MPRLRIFNPRRETRVQRFIRLLGLPPAEDRGFMPRTDDDRIWDGIDNSQYFYPRPTSMKAATGEETGPGWDNVVRALEEDR